MNNSCCQGNKQACALVKMTESTCCSRQRRSTFPPLLGLDPKRRIVHYTAINKRETLQSADEGPPYEKQRLPEITGVERETKESERSRVAEKKRYGICSIVTARPTNSIVLTTESQSLGEEVGFAASEREGGQTCTVTAEAGATAQVDCQEQSIVQTGQERGGGKA